MNHATRHDPNWRRQFCLTSEEGWALADYLESGYGPVHTLVSSGRLQVTRIKKAMPVDDFVGAALRMRRKELGLTQTDLARGLGITLQQVQKYETGMNRITAGRLAAAAELLQSPISYFFEGPRKSKRDASEELALLKASGAKDLLRSYAEIRSPQDRKALLHIAKSLRHRRSEDSRA